MYNSTEVSRKMIQMAKDKGLGLSNLQLQKLIYISHGYLLGWKCRPLISEQIEAWTYGPIISAIYHQYSQHGENKIVIDQEIQTSLDGDQDALHVIDGVLNLYGDLDAVQLVTLTSQANTPWHDVWSKKGELPTYPMDNESIKNHYRKALADPGMVSGL